MASDAGRRGGGRLVVDVALQATRLLGAAASSPASPRAPHSLFLCEPGLLAERLDDACGHLQLSISN